MSLLGFIPQDQTFDQGQGLDSLFDRFPGAKFHSYDLSAFTDRFPIELLVEFLSVAVSKSYADNWRNVMVSLPFAVTQKGPLRTGSFFAYAVGTPMGMYSSWSVSSLCHHLLVYKCCIRMGIPFSTAKYKLLGDDIVI